MQIGFGPFGCIPKTLLGDLAIPLAWSNAPRMSRFQAQTDHQWRTNKSGAAPSYLWKRDGEAKQYHGLKKQPHLFFSSISYCSKQFVREKKWDYHIWCFRFIVCLQGQRVTEQLRKIIEFILVLFRTCSTLKKVNWTMPGEEFGCRMVLTASGKRYESIYANHVLGFDYDGPQLPNDAIPCAEAGTQCPISSTHALDRSAAVDTDVLPLPIIPQQEKGKIPHLRCTKKLFWSGDFRYQSNSVTVYML